MACVGIIGGGAFGTAMACVVRRSGHEVRLWAREAEVVDSINRDRVNAHFLPGVSLQEGITATSDIARAASDVDFLLVAVPAQHVREIAGQFRAALRPALPVVSCSKGIERGSGALMPEVLVDMLPGAIVAVLSGPSFAREIATDLTCGVVLACSEWEAGEMLARAISNPHFCVQLSSDVAGAALAGAMKNVIAIASGICYGLEMGENARATLITLGLEEASRLGRAKGANPVTFMGLAGAGDFMLTAHSIQSRNTSMGVALAQGRTVEEILGARKEVTEGAASVEAVTLLARRLHVEMPITQALDQVINHGVPVRAAIEALRRHLPPLLHAG